MDNRNRSFMVTNVEQYITDLIEAWNTHDIDRITPFYAPDYEGTDVGQPDPHYGMDGIRKAFGWILRAFPDVHFTVDQIVAQDTEVALVWTAHGTHQGHLMNIPPTGRAIAARGVSILTIQDGKIKKALYIWDVAGILRGIGLLPEL